MSACVIRSIPGLSEHSSIPSSQAKMRGQGALRLRLLRGSGTSTTTLGGVTRYELPPRAYASLEGAKCGVAVELSLHGLRISDRPRRRIANPMYIATLPHRSGHCRPRVWGFDPLLKTTQTH